MAYGERESGLVCKWAGRRDVGVWCETWVWMLDGMWLAEREDWTCKWMEISWPVQER